MTSVLPPAGKVRTLTLEDVRRELDSLKLVVDELGYSLEEFKDRGDRWELDADERGLLSDIRGLESFLDRGSR